MPASRFSGQPEERNEAAEAELPCAEPSHVLAPLRQGRSFPGVWLARPGSLVLPAVTLKIRPKGRSQRAKILPMILGINGIRLVGKRSGERPLRRGHLEMLGSHERSFQGFSRLYASSHTAGCEAAVVREKYCAAFSASLGYVGNGHSLARTRRQRSPILPKLCVSASGALPYFPDPSSWVV
jgi:hypothetical protein